MLSGVEVLGEEQIYRGRKIALKKILLRIRGSKTFHEVVEYGESVAALPFINEDEVILIRQFRGAVGGWLLEIPAGKVERGESPEEACRRELEEEIGYRPLSLRKLASCYLSPGYSDEIIHIYVARDLRPVGQRLEEHEAIRILRMRYDRLLASVQSGEIADAKTILAVAMYEVAKSRWQRR